MEFYHRVGSLYDALSAKKGTLKGLCMKESGKPGEGGRFMRVLESVLSHEKALKWLVEKYKLTDDGKGGSKSIFVHPQYQENLKTNGKHGWKSKKRISSPDSLAIIMLHDLLFAKRGLALPKGHRIYKHLDELKQKLLKALQNHPELLPSPDASKTTIQEGALTAEQRQAIQTDSLALGQIRWLRINTLKWSLDEAIEWFNSRGYLEVESLDQLLQQINTGNPGEKLKIFALDEHLPFLLAFPLSIHLPSLAPFTDSRVIAQDKASCIPPWVLIAGELSHSGKGKSGRLRIMDATSAPGNKTTLAALLVNPESKLEFDFGALDEEGNEIMVEGNKLDGSVIAVERDPNRYQVLKKRVAELSDGNITTLNKDFLSIEHEDKKFKNVTHILVDPSCSGSGIHLGDTPLPEDLNAPYTPPESEVLRLRKLSNFQTTILSHALRFPSVRKVVYSTCSIWGIENEQVVERILRKPEFIEQGWRLEERQNMLPSWERRGIVDSSIWSGDKDQADKLIRCVPEEDHTNGFFVACFVRNLPEDEELQEDITMMEDEEAPQPEKLKGKKSKKRTQEVVQVGEEMTIEVPEPKVNEPEIKENKAKKPKSSKKAKYLEAKAALKKTKSE